MQFRHVAAAVGTQEKLEPLVEPREGRGAHWKMGGSESWLQKAEAQVEEGRLGEESSYLESNKIQTEVMSCNICCTLKT